MNDENKSQGSEGIGKLMTFMAWIGLLAFLTLIFNNLLLEQYNPNRNLDEQLKSGEIPEVVLERNKQGHYLSEGRINRMPVVFLLDTGATDIAIPEVLADRLRLPRLGGGVSQTANGAVAVWKTRLDEVSIGNIRLHDVSASILPSMGKDDAVLLGMSFLKRVDMLQQGNTLTLRKVQ